MTRRMTAFILTCITVLAAVVPLSACAPQPIESAPTQEEIQAEFIEIMRYMGLYLPPDYESKHERPYKVKVAEGVEIYEEDLKVYLHVYELDTDFENIPTAEEVEGLYNEYEQVTYVKFLQFYDWYRNNGGAACDDYLEAMLHIDLRYTEEQGSYFKNIQSWSDYTVEDFIDLESYVKENPDYTETNYAYKRLLKWLGLE